MEKKTLGGRQIEMKLIENMSNRRVTFSKRRRGLFNKASEICVQTGAEIAIIVQSLAGKCVFAGPSNVDSVIARFENGITSDDSVGNDAKTQDFKRDYSEVSAKLEVEKWLQRDGVNDGGGFWWDMEVDDIDLDQLENFKAALEAELKILIAKAETSSSLLNTAGPVSGIRGWLPSMETQF